MRDADDDRLLLPFQREHQQEETWKKNLRRRRNKRFFSLFAVVSFVVFLSISFWFTEEGTQNMEKVFEREEIGRLIDLDKERSIDVIITRLRKKIEIDPKNPKFLQTIRGAGYVLWIE